MDLKATAMGGCFFSSFLLIAFSTPGGAGFIGSHTCAELLESGYQVIVLDNFYNSKIESLLR